MLPGVTLAIKILMNIITVEKYTNNATKNYTKSIKIPHDIQPTKREGGRTVGSGRVATIMSN